MAHTFLPHAPRARVRVNFALRREALSVRVEVRDLACGLSQQVAVAEGSLIRVVAGRAGAALTKPGRPSTARWGGSGERGGKEYARNRRFTSFNRRTDSNLVDTGRAQRAPLPVRRRELPGGIAKPYREAMGKACGVPMAMLLGHSRAPNPLSGPQ